MKGIDVSSYQGDIDWAKVAASGYSFVIVKATQGAGVTDHNFRNNVTNANISGLKVGAYHFCIIGSTPDIVSDAISEANYFDSALKSVSNLLTLPIVADIETKSSSNTQEQVLLYINTFFKTLSDLGYTNVALYSNPSFLNENLPAWHSLGDIKLWIAEYGVASPKIPNGWDKYWCWQNSQSGIVNGVTGNVDTNFIPDVVLQPEITYINPPPETPTPNIPIF